MDNKIISDRTYTVIEVCPHCENEIEMRWDTEALGYKAFCPVCGRRLMLCDECRHAGDGACDYDGKTDSCKHNPSWSDLLAEQMWEEFEDVPMDPQTECIEIQFQQFPVGTHREEIWHWFDNVYSKGVYGLMYFSQKGVTDK